MKRLFIIAMSIMAFVSISCNNNGKASSELSHKDSLLLEQLQVFQSQLRDEPFKLYYTKNMYTFLELNTGTGQIWIVQWSTDDDKRFRYVLDDRIRISKEDEQICGRFSLHATDNIYNFILLDNINGKCWQVQWSFDEDKRLVLPIY
jgi:hypothetical protein